MSLGKCNQTVSPLLSTMFTQVVVVILARKDKTRPQATSNCCTFSLSNKDGEEALAFTVMIHQLNQEKTWGEVLALCVHWHFRQAWRCLTYRWSFPCSTLQSWTGSKREAWVHITSCSSLSSNGGRKKGRSKRWGSYLSVVASSPMLSCPVPLKNMQEKRDSTSLAHTPYSCFFHPRDEMNGSLRDILLPNIHAKD